MSISDLEVEPVDLDALEDLDAAIHRRALTPAQMRLAEEVEERMRFMEQPWWERAKLRLTRKAPKGTYEITRDDVAAHDVVMRIR